uniref:Uncharacterized protein n=1 Tax=Medicago truncatula TaxID=3880 RepID=I3S3S7_MEDTR|nr:unknown [Medicago truncatula]
MFVPYMSLGVFCPIDCAELSLIGTAVFVLCCSEELKWLVISAA